MKQNIGQIIKTSLLSQCKIRNCRSLLKGTHSYVLTRASLFWNPIRLRSTCSEIIGHSDLMLEDGMVIQELPVIVRKITEAHLLDSFKTMETRPNISEKFLHKSQERETKEMIEGFDKCHTPKSVFALLELIPPSEILPSVALQALKTIVKFENNMVLKNKLGINLDIKDKDQTTNITINNLVDTIIMSEENCQILEALQLVSEEIPEKNISLIRQKLCNEVLIRIADGRFSISEICKSAKSLLISGNHFDIDKLWVGIIEKQGSINEKNIVEVFRLLAHVNLSRSLFLKILQKQLEIIALKLKSEEVAEILTILYEINEFPYSMIKCLSYWLELMILKVNDEELGSIIKGFMGLPSLEENVVKAIEKFMILKKFEIRNPELVATIMDYCNKYKIRSEAIFNSCSAYFVKNAKCITPAVLKSIFLPFGNLNFQPLEDEHFWRVLEEELMEKFVHLYSEDALDIMLSFIFLEKYPIKFVAKIFNPYFLDRLHLLKETQQIYLMRTKLKLLDTALTLECSQYQGPLLLSDFPSSAVKLDPRIKKMSDHLTDEEILPSILDSDKSILSSVVLKNLPLTELYVVDIIIHPKGKSSLFYLMDSWNDFIALLIHLPEHYDSSGRHLIGSQVMRKRHLRCLGLNVVDLEYNIVSSLLADKQELRDYLKHRLHNVE